MAIVSCAAIYTLIHVVAGPGPVRRDDAHTQEASRLVHRGDLVARARRAMEPEDRDPVRVAVLAEREAPAALELDHRGDECALHGTSLPPM